ncbi:hypothetical protein ACWGS9_33205 [Bradyrhizobium sp. Arg314]
MTTMTVTLEIQIEQLCAELQNGVERTERRQIEAELELALAELAASVAEQEGIIDAAPPL